MDNKFFAVVVAVAVAIGIVVVVVVVMTSTLDLVFFALIVVSSRQFWLLNEADVVVATLQIGRNSHLLMLLLLLLFSRQPLV